MRLEFDEPQSPYSSGSQSARVWTETWINKWVYCPHCGNAQMSRFPNNTPLADFLCPSCKEEFELKSQKSKFGAKVADGAYTTKCERLEASNNPNLLLMNYDLKSLAVVNLFIVPKHFFVRDIIEERKPSKRRRVAPVGSDQTSCLVKYRSLERFTSFGTASYAPRKPFSQNGKRLYY